jgi:release factor glutamine methyltransferase
VARHGLEGRAELVSGDWDAALGAFDLILANPPYIPTADLARLPLDIREYEPQAALDGGPDGLSAYRALAPVLASKLDVGGVAALEIGAEQPHVIREIMAAHGLTVARIAPDLAGIPRCGVLRAA